MVKFCGIVITFAKFWYIVVLGMLKIEGDMIQNIKIWSLKKVVYLLFLNVKITTSFISQKFNQYWTYRDLPYTKLTDFYKDFDGLFRFEIAPFFEGENLTFVRPLFMLNALCPDEC